MINGINNFNRFPEIRSKKAQSRSLSSFCEMLDKSVKKDSFTAELPVNPVQPPKNAAIDFSSTATTQAKLDNISEAIENTDYSGMTQAEIYADIEKKYEDTFEDFQILTTTALCTDHITVCDHFRDELKSHGIDTVTEKIYREAKGYTGMSYEEIEAAIKEKYAGKTGFFDQLNLVGELYKTGVLDNKYGSNEAFVFMSRFSLSIECSGDKCIPRSEWLARLQKTGVSSPFTLFVNYPYFSDIDREFFKTVVDDILFGITDKKN
ncbi:MAG: hypothetical protein NC120_06390 [Ruminococcus sp.]|nr:hypothetical protein [Ruminococcus sp.]